MARHDINHVATCCRGFYMYPVPVQAATRFIGGGLVQNLAVNTAYTPGAGQEAAATAAGNVGCLGMGAGGSGSAPGVGAGKGGKATAPGVMPKFNKEKKAPAKKTKQLHRALQIMPHTTHELSRALHLGF